MCIGRSPSVCNAFVSQGLIPFWSIAFTHLSVWECIFWGRFISHKFVHLSLVHLTGSRYAACMTQSVILLPFFLFLLGFSLPPCSTVPKMTEHPFRPRSQDVWPWTLKNWALEYLLVKLTIFSLWWSVKHENFLIVSKNKFQC